MDWQDTYDIIQEGIAFVDKEGKFIRTNPAYSELTGYSQNELVGRQLCHILHPDDCGELRGTTLKRIVTKNNELVWIRCILTPIGDICFHQAITIKNGAREQLKKVDNNVVVSVKEETTLGRFIGKHWWRLTQVVGAILLTLIGWITSAAIRMYADGSRLDRLERNLEKIQQESQHK